MKNRKMTVLLATMSLLTSSALHAQYEWVRKYGILGKHEEITETAFGGSDRLYVSGVYYNNTQLDGEDLEQGAVDYKGTFVAALNASGQLQWVNSYRASEGTDVPVMAVAPDGSVYLSVKYTGDITVGSFNLNSGSNSFGGGSILLAKFDAAGAVQWATTYEAKKSEPRDMVVAANGDVLLTGVFHTSIDFGGTTLSAWTGLTWESFVAKVSPSDGSVSWAVKTDSDKESGVRSVATDDAGNVYIGGMFKDSLRFSPSVAFGFYEIPGSSTTASNRRNAFFAKYDATGGFQWAKQVKGENDARVLLTYANDDLYASFCSSPNNGYFLYDADSIPYLGVKDFVLRIDPADGSRISHMPIPGFIFSLTSDNTDAVFVSYGHVTVAQIDASDNVVWAETRSAGGTTVAGSAISALDGAVFVGGTIYGVSDIELEPGLILPPGETGYKDGWFAFLNGNGSPAGIAEASGINCNVYPNPASGTVYVSAEQPGASARIRISDISGRIFLEQDTDTGKTALDIGNIPAGTYIVSITGSGRSTHRRLVVN